MLLTEDRIVVWSYGGGVDGTGALIAAVTMGYRAPHAILFANTKGEKPHTYAHIDHFSKWLVAHGWPAITVLTSVNRAGEPISLESESLRTNRLPSLAYGFKTCSQRFKVDPQNKWCNNDPVCRAEWKAGRKIIKVVGYNFDETWRAKFYDQPKYDNCYPLIEWQFGRVMCADLCMSALGYVPEKSACFFCPASTKPQILDLRARYPHLADRALAMERNAHLTKIKGLGRRFNWGDFLAGVSVPDLPSELEIPCDCYDGD